jgi:protein LSM14
MTSSTAIPYIGARINLISKSDIRYEGILYSIDPIQSTVTLTQGNGFFSSLVAKRVAKRVAIQADFVLEHILFIYVRQFIHNFFRFFK